MRKKNQVTDHPFENRSSFNYCQFVKADGGYCGGAEACHSVVAPAPLPQESETERLRTLVLSNIHDRYSPDRESRLTVLADHDHVRLS